MLIQGPPGVGKPALIHQLGKEAKAKDWEVIRLNNKSLYNKKEFFKRLTQNKNAQEIQTTYGIDLKLFKWISFLKNRKKLII
ncbi:MAG: AAA family ATPase [Flavobacteriaceae bacterium]|nr:AAA family ATPase [Flavobacteriaceae bacterium]MCY4217013.1 AAA family ATPase [Flavobacteriaceae bacterium]